MLLALVICITPLCLSVANSSENVSHIKVPIKVEDLPRGTLLTSPLVQGIEIQVRGPAEIRDRLSNLNLQYRLDLSHLEPGSHTIPIQVQQLHLPLGLSIDNFQPQAIPIRLELEVRKEVPITVFYKGTPAPGYFVVQTVAVPNMVMLSGPKRELDKIESVSTHPIDVAGIADTFKKEITLALPENIKSIALSDPILVSVEISEEIQTQNFKGILVEILGSRDRCEINPAYISMDIKGPVKLLKGLTNHPDFRVSVDTRGLEPGVYVRRATIELPVGTTLIQVEPEIFTVTISDQQ